MSVDYNRVKAQYRTNSVIKEIDDRFYYVDDEHHLNGPFEDAESAADELQEIYKELCDGS